MPKVFEHPLSEESLKTNNVPASQNCGYSELLFSCSINSFVSMKQDQNFRENISHAASHAQVISSAKIYEKNNSEIEPKNDQSTELQKTFDLVKQFVELFQQY